MQDAARTIRSDELLAQMGWVRALARSLVADPHDAQDLAQEAWLSASTRPPAEIADERGLRAWLATVVHNLARKGARGRGRRGQREERAARPEAQPATVDVVARGALHDELSSAVMSLREPQRSAVLWRYLDGLDAKEIARRQGVSHAAARQRISRGLAELRARLDAAHGGERAAWSTALLSLAELPGSAGGVAGTLGSTWLGVLPVLLKSSLVVVTAILLALVLLPFFRGAGTERETERIALAPDAPLGSGPEVMADGDLADEPRRAAEAGFAVTVVDERGAPRADLLALWLADSQLVESARTDAQGVASVGGQVVCDELLLAGNGLVPRRVPLELGDQRVVLDSGARVSGHVRVEAGGGPRSLRLSHDRPALEFEGLEPQVVAALQREGLDACHCELALDADGRFECAGLSADWTGALELPGEWRFAVAPRVGAVEDERALLLLAPAAELELELSAPRAFRGRVVTPGGGAPVEHALVSAQVYPQGGVVPAAVEARSDAQGRFELALATAAQAGTHWRLRVTVQFVAGGASQRRMFWGSELPADGELGSFELQPERGIELSVKDEGGAPIVGASARVGGREQVTDERGRARFAGVALDAEALVVSARGFAPQRRMLTDAMAFEVVLRASNGLVVRVVDAAGRALAHGRLRVECDGSPFELEGSAETAQAAFRQTFELDGEGTLALSALAPGRLLSLTAVGEQGAELARRDVIAPGPLEQRELELVTTQGSFAFEGRVMDEHGRGLPRATIALEGAGMATSVTTDADGRFVLEPLRGALEGVYVEVRRPGFLTAVLRDLAIDESTPALEVRLEEGRALEVLLVDSDGRMVEGAGVYAAFEGSGGGIAREIEPGRYRFAGVARAAGDLIVDLGVVEIQRALEAEVGLVRLELPTMGALELEVDPGHEVEGGARVCAVIEAVGGAGGSTRKYFIRSAAGLAPMKLPLPVGAYRVQLEERVLVRRGKVRTLGEPVSVEVDDGGARRLVLP